MTTENFTVFLKQLGRGKQGQKSLSREQAQAAMRLILKGEVSNLQLGAFLLLLRVKEETVEELAGFADAINSTMSSKLKTPLIDFSVASYAAKSRHNVWSVLALCALANNGYKVVIHGWQQNAEDVTVYQAFKQLTLPIADSPTSLQHHLANSGITYYPTQELLPAVASLLNLKNELGLRTVINTIVRIINPFNAKYCIGSFFHPSYGPLQQQAATLTGQSLLTFKGDGGEAEIRPQADTQLLITHKGIEQSLVLPRKIKEKPEDETTLSIDALQNVWRNGFVDSYSEHAVKGTIKAILLAFIPDAATDKNIDAIWQSRQKDFL